MTPNSFLIVLRSVDDPRGQSSNFTYHFEPPLKLDGKWQVALSDYIAPNANSFIYERNVFAEIVRQDGLPHEPETEKIPRKIEFQLADTDYISSHALAQELIEKLHAKEMFRWSNKKQEHLEYKPVVCDGVKYILRFNNTSLLKALGFNPEDWDEINKSSSTNEKLLSIHLPRIFYHDRTLCVKTNIISGEYNTLGVFLTTIDYGVLVKVQAPIYLDVALQEISKININLTSINGAKIVNNNGYTIAVLHFKRV